MSKIILNDVVGNISTIAGTVNNNSEAITTAIENTLSRDGTSPNYMSSELDMNSNQIINLPTPSTQASPVRLEDLAEFTTSVSSITFNNIYETNSIITPETFGAVGNGVVDDTTAINAMTAFGRTNGSLSVVLSKGKTYTCTNPYTFSGIPYLKVEGNGANWMNPRGTSSPINTFLANYDTLVLGSTPHLGNGPVPFAGGAFFGVKINSASPGATSITTIDGSNMPTGRALIYATDRQQSASFPPCTRCFEYINITSAIGATGTLANPLQYLYDSTAPETGTLSQTITASISGNVLTVTATSGTISPFTYLVGNTIPYNSFITSQLTGSAGSTGTYSLSLTYPVAVSSSTMHTSTDGNIYGAARVISCEDSINFPYGQGRFAYLNGINFIANPNFTAFGSSSSNGRVTLQGFDKIIANNCTAVNLYVSAADSVDSDSFVLTGTQVLELDKLVRVVNMKRFVGQPSSGFGIYKVNFEDCFFPVGTAVGTLDSVSYKNCTFQGTAVGDGSSKIGVFLNKGSPKIIVDNCKIITDTSTDRFFRSNNYSLVVDVSVSAPTLTFSRTNYYSTSSGAAINNVLRIGSVFTDVNGLPVFRVTRLPYCSGDQLTGNVSIDGDLYGTISVSDTINLSGIESVDFHDNHLEGTSGSRLTALLSTAPGTLASPFPNIKIRDKYITNTSVTITSEMCSFNRASNLYVMYLGQIFCPSEVVINVTKAGGAATTLQLKYVDPAGTSNVLYNLIDLTTVGRRIIDRSGITTLGTDDTTGSSLHLTNMQELTFQDTSASAADPSPAIWSATVYGTWIAQQGGTS